MNGGTAIEISLLEVVVLGCDDRPRLRVGIEIVGVIAGHAAQRAYGVGGKNVLVGEAPHGFKVIAILQLTTGNEHAVGWWRGTGRAADGVIRVRHVRSILLHIFVGDGIAREFMADNQGQTVFLGQVALIVHSKTGGGAIVGVILRDHGVEIMVCHVAGGTQAEGISLPRVLILSIDSGRIVTAAEKSELSVKPGIAVFESIDLNHATHLAAKFRGNAGGIDLQGFGIIGFYLWAEAGRTVVGEGNAIHNELGLIFRTPGVKDGVAFVEPTGF